MSDPLAKGVLIYETNGSIHFSGFSNDPYRMPVSFKGNYSPATGSKITASNAEVVSVSTPLDAIVGSHQFIGSVGNGGVVVDLENGLSIRAIVSLPHIQPALIRGSGIGKHGA